MTMLCVIASFLCMGNSKAEVVSIFGLPHTPLGNAEITLTNGSLIVSNIGEGGDDGVFIGLPSNTSLWHAHFDGLGGVQSYAPGSFLQINGVATINGIPNQIGSTGLVTNIGAAWAITFDFSRVSSDPLLAQYFLGGELVGVEMITDPTSAVWLTGDTATDGGVTKRVASDIPGFWDIELTWKDPNKKAAISTPSGQELVLDTMRVVTTGIDILDDGYSGAALTASGISSFTIKNEDLVTHQVPEPSSLLLVGVSLAGLASARGRWCVQYEHGKYVKTNSYALGFKKIECT